MGFGKILGSICDEISYLAHLSEEGGDAGMLGPGAAPLTGVSTHTLQVSQHCV